MTGPYEPHRDYRNYVVDDSDGPLLTTRQSAGVLGHRTTQGVRGLIASGRLPSRRRNRNHLVPEWATRGRRAWTEQTLETTETPSTSPASRAREIELESALFALRAAAQHEKRARKLQHKALKEMAKANDILKEVVGAVAVPDAPHDLSPPT